MPMQITAAPASVISPSMDDMPLDEPGDAVFGDDGRLQERQEHVANIAHDSMDDAERHFEIHLGDAQSLLGDEDDDDGEVVTRLLQDVPKESGGPSEKGLLVRTGDVDVVIPLRHEGITVGRLSTNDVVLHARSVSREHVRFLPTAYGAVVEDLGATNPATVRGKKVLSQQELSIGDVVEVCGAHIVVVAQA